MNVFDLDDDGLLVRPVKPPWAIEVAKLLSQTAAGKHSTDRTLRFQRLAVMFVALVALYQPTGFSQGQIEHKRDVQASPLPMNLYALLSSNTSMRATELKSLLLQRQQLVSNLIAIVNGSGSSDAKHDAAFLLGQYRAPEAIPSLIKNLDLLPGPLDSIHFVVDIMPGMDVGSWHGNY